VLDQDESDAAAVAADVPEGERRTRTSIVVLSLVGLAIALSVAFWPSVFKGVTSYDDEGSFLVAIRQFMHHGSLYVHTHGPYGPFWFSLAGVLFRLTGHDPTLTSGRIIVLVFTGLSAAMFGATVWRVTRSLSFSLLCEVSTYIVLIRVAGTEPMHPGSMIVLVLSVLTYAVASYVMNEGTAALVVIGASVGVLAMIKINVGILAAAAILIAFVVGNAQWPKWIRIAVGVGGVLFPFLVTSQLLYQVDTTILAVIVSVGLLATYAALSVDTINTPRRAVWVAGAGAAAAVIVSCLWPLTKGTSIGALVHGVVIQPLGQTDNLQKEHGVHFDQLSFVLTVLAVVAVFARRYAESARRWARSWQLDAAFGVAGLLVLGLGIYGGFGAWLPAIALIPALALLSDASSQVRLAIRFLVPVAILQLLHAYPVAGSQVSWSRVVVCVPCVIAMAAAVDRFPAWHEVGPAVRGVAVGALALLTVAVAGFLPITQWHNYNRHIALNLPGTHFIHVPPHQYDTLHTLVNTVTRHCDTFYSAPGFDSLYIYTGLPNPTGLLADGPGALDGKEQRELIRQLDKLQQGGKRVCIVRDIERAGMWRASSYGKGPLGKGLARYTRKIFRVDNWTISLHNSTRPKSTGRRPSRRRPAHQRPTRRKSTGANSTS
jgi:hypothetical protein